MAFLARFGRSAGKGLAKYAQVQCRGFAEAAPASKGLDVQTHGVHGRYALALFNAGAKSSVLDSVTEDLAGVLSMADKSDDFAQFLSDPTVPKKTKQEVMSNTLGELSAQEVTKEFFGVLADNNRLSLLPKIAETYEELVSASRGEVTAKLTTAEAPDEETLEVIKSGLNDLLKAGQSLNLVLKVNPVIIGGLIIELGDKRVDMSILSRVKRIQQLLRETV